MKFLYFLIIFLTPIKGNAQVTDLQGLFLGLKELIWGSGVGNPGLVQLILALSFIFFLWGMATFILNSGSEEKREEGKKKMIWGIIAIFVIVSLWGIIAILQQSFFGGSLPPSPGPGF